eukprot:jgi/Tetstr1/463126/TSEL_008060.t1
MVDAGKEAAVGSAETAATVQNSIEAARREAEGTRMKQRIQEHLSPDGEEDAIPDGNESRAGGHYRNVPVELRKLPAVGDMRNRRNYAGLRAAARGNTVEAIDDGHRFRMAYLRQRRDTKTHHGDTFVIDVVRERYLRLGPENLGSPEFTELLELYKDRAYDANIASAAKTTTHQRFGGAFRCNDRDRDGGGSSRKHFKTTHPGR